MKTSNFAIMGLTIIVILGGVFALPKFLNDSSDISKNTDTNKQESSSSETSKFRTISTGSTDSGDVSIELTPRSAKNGVLEVDIAANTHSVDLSQFDLTKITSLEYDGNTVVPISAPSLSGHHSSGTLKFNVEDKIDGFTIKIRGIPKIGERVFEWK